jgi:uncharacterized membrane protein
MKSLLIIATIILVLDTLYLSTIGGKPFLKMVENIQKKSAVMDYLSAAVVYLLMIIGFNYFVVQKRFSNTEAFLFGVLLYGVFDFTNMALFSDYKLTIAIQDTLWGGVLFYLTNVLYHYYLQW